MLILHYMIYNGCSWTIDSNEKTSHHNICFYLTLQQLGRMIKLQLFHEEIYYFYYLVGRYLKQHRYGWVEVEVENMNCDSNLKLLNYLDGNIWSYETQVTINNWIWSLNILNQVFDKFQRQKCHKIYMGNNTK